MLETSFLTIFYVGCHDAERVTKYKKIKERNFTIWLLKKIWGQGGINQFSLLFLTKNKYKPW